MIKRKDKKQRIDIPFPTVYYREGWKLSKNCTLSNEDFETYTASNFVPINLQELYYYIRFKDEDNVKELNYDITNLLLKLALKKIDTEKSYDIWVNKINFDSAIIQTKNDISEFFKFIKSLKLDIKVKLQFDGTGLIIYKKDSSGNILCTLKEWKEKLDILKEMLESKDLEILTGGPGCGKTYKTIRELHDNNMSFLVLTLSNLVGANFIKRHNYELKKDGSNSEGNFSSYAKFRYCGDKFKNNYDAIIFEEASMLSTSELDFIINAVSRGRKIYFCGDTNQLPSFLGYGNILWGVISEFPQNVINLTRNYRSQSLTDAQNMSSILKNCKFAKVDSELNVTKIFEDLIGNEEDVKAITLANTKVDNFNLLALRAIASKINPIYKNEKDIYQLIDVILSNGNKIKIRSVGTISHKDDETGKTVYDFYTNEMGVMYLKQNGNVIIESNMFEDHKMTYANLNELKYNYVIGRNNVFDLGYSLTVHKSQGLEFDYICYFSPNNQYLENANLAYVGVSRAKKQTFIADDNSTKRKLKFLNIFR